LKLIKLYYKKNSRRPTIITINSSLESISSGMHNIPSDSEGMLAISKELEYCFMIGRVYLYLI